MDTEKMRYPFGRCAKCGKEFSFNLRREHNITHCPWCGAEIDDFMSPSANEHPDDIYCEDCGRRIYERGGENGKGGDWIDEKAGVCSGPCERELCGNCGDWDINGECEFCRNSPCGQCPNHEALDVCRQCEHLADRKRWANWEDENPYKGREDERDCHCNSCEAKFREGEIKISGDEEICAGRCSNIAG